MKKTFFFLAITLVCNLTYGQDFATALVFELADEKFGGSRILLAFDNEKTEIIPLENLGTGLKGFDEKDQIRLRNQVTISKIIKRVDNLGLELISTNTGGCKTLYFRRKVGKKNN